MDQDDIFYQAGRAAGKGVRKARWLWESLTGTPSAALQAEYEAGCDLARAMDARVERDEDPVGNRLLAEIGAELTGSLPGEPRRWRIRLVRTDEPGAFVLPGGFVYVTRPLLELCRHDANELACIVGHEMGHVVEGHVMERVTNELLLTGVRRAARLSPNALARWIVFAGARLFQSAYSQDQELAADEFGVRLAHRAGYDPRGGIRVLERLRSLGDAPDVELASYFASHPPLPERIAALQSLIRVRPAVQE